MTFDCDSDSDTIIHMKKLVSIVLFFSFVILFSCKGTVSVPEVGEIGGIEGEGTDSGLVHGQSYVLKGSNFGIKDPVEPKIYDTFDDKPAGDQWIEAYGYWWIFGPPSDDVGDRRPWWSSEKQRDGVQGDVSVLQEYGLDQRGLPTMNKDLGIHQSWVNKMYISLWIYRDIDLNAVEQYLDNAKIFGNWGPFSGFPVCECTGQYNYGSNHLRHHVYDENAPEGERLIKVDDEGFDKEAFKWNRWHRLERYTDIGTLNTADGESWMDIDCERYAAISGIFNINDDAKFEVWHIGNYFAQQLDHDGIYPDYSSLPCPIPMKQFISEAYADTTLQRIEMGDAQNWGNCTHREVQLPEAWSEGEIKFKTNKGSFADGAQVYLFVINENGVASDGYSVTLATP